MSKDLLAQWNQLQRKMAGFHSGDPEPALIWTPTTDIYETPDGLVVKVELAGVPPGNVQLYLTENALVVEGVRRMAGSLSEGWACPDHHEECV